MTLSGALLTLFLLGCVRAILEGLRDEISPMLFSKTSSLSDRLLAALFLVSLAWIGWRLAEKWL